MEAAGSGRLVSGRVAPESTARPGLRRTRVEAGAPAAARVFAASLVFLGVLHVIFGADLTRMLPVWSGGGPPGRPFWTPGMGVLLTITAGLTLRRSDSRRAALALAAVLMLPVLLVQAPRAVASGRLDHEWLNVFKWLAMASGALVLAAERPGTGTAWPDRIGEAGAAAAPGLLGIFMFQSARQHVQHAPFVAQLMQPWMPARDLWVFFAAAALACGAIGLLIPRTAWLAALLTSLMIFSWFWLVHTPRMLIDPAGPVGWSEMAESLAFAALALLLAARAHRQERRRIARPPLRRSDVPCCCLLDLNLAVRAAGEAPAGGADVRDWFGSPPYWRVTGGSLRSRVSTSPAGSSRRRGLTDYPARPTRAGTRCPAAVRASDPDP